LAKWGRRLLARKGQINLVVAAMARKLTVAVWYLMMGRWTPLEEIDDRLAIKVGKMITSVGKDALKTAGKTRGQYRQEVYARLIAGRVYVLDRSKKCTPKSTIPEPKTLLEEYGLR
jgi:hypothetical protein